MRFYGLPISKAPIVQAMYHRVGMRINYAKLNTDIDFINKQLLKSGFLLASVKHISISDSGLLSIHIESPVVREVTFSGLNSAPSWYVYRELLTKNGDQLNQQILDSDIASLTQLPVFSSVSGPLIEYISSENVRLAYRVTEKKVNLLDIGLEELEDNQGVAIFSKLRWYHRFIYSDFIELQFQLGYLNELSSRAYRVRYHQPWLLNRFPVGFDFSVYNKYLTEVYQQSSVAYQTVRLGGALGLSRRFKKSKSVLGASFKVEEVRPQDSGEFNSYDLRAILLSYEKNKLNDFRYPTKGFKSKIAYDIGGNLHFLDLGGVDFNRFRFSQSFFQSYDKLTLAFQLFAGRYQNNSDILTFETEKFSLGGANSLRGYNDFSFFGNYRSSFNLEGRYRVNSGIAMVLFLDGGFIQNEYSQLFDTLHTGYGLGIRFLETVVPIRVDLARGNDIMVHFNVSQTF